MQVINLLTLNNVGIIIFVALFLALLKEAVEDLLCLKREQGTLWVNPLGEPFVSSHFYAYSEGKITVIFLLFFKLISINKSSLIIEFSVPSTFLWSTVIQDT